MWIVFSAVGWPKRPFRSVETSRLQHDQDHPETSPSRANTFMVCFVSKLFEMSKISWWCQICSFMFNPIWDRDPSWLICFGVETTNQLFPGLESRSLQTNPAKLETALLERAHRTQQNLLQKDFAWLSRFSKDALGWLKACKKAGAVARKRREAVSQQKDKFRRGWKAVQFHATNTVPVLEPLS